MTKAYALLLVLFVAALLFGCGKLTLSSSTLNVESNELERVESIVDASFIELGFGNYSSELCSSRHSPPNCFEMCHSLYKIRGEKNKGGTYTSYNFYVTYKVLNRQIDVQILNRDSSGSDYRRLTISDHLNKITELINKRLQEASLRVSVETKSYWVPNPYK